MTFQVAILTAPAWTLGYRWAPRLADLPDQRLWYIHPRGDYGPLAGLARHRINTRLIAHGWDLAQATGQPAKLPEDLAEQALAFVRIQLATQSRAGRFGPAHTATQDAPAIDRLVAFLGRPLTATR